MHDDTHGSTKLHARVTPAPRMKRARPVLVVLLVSAASSPHRHTLAALGFSVAPNLRRQLDNATA